MGEQRLSLKQFMARHGFVNHVHRKKSHGRPMPEKTRRATGRRSKVRAHVNHALAERKEHMGLFIRTISLVRAVTKIRIANLVYNMKRLIWLKRMDIA
jgi:hypothetical protein